eukprot:COSAG02_NODE_142_length_34188_cov_183.180791_26_plen_101_part_00
MTLVVRVATAHPNDSTHGWQLAVYNSTQPGTSGTRLGECTITQTTGGFSGFEDFECVHLHAGVGGDVLHLAFVVEAYSLTIGPQDEAPAELLRIDSFQLV